MKSLPIYMKIQEIELGTREITVHVTTNIMYSSVNLMHAFI